MKLYAVTGNPILFSRSPEIFNSIFQQKNIDAKYTRLAAKSACETIELFKEFNMSGMNVTAPFKTDIIKYLDKIDQIASEIGSVNTVVNEKGLLIGYNTDYYGIINTLKAIKNKKILLLGAGGAAKAVIYSIMKNGGSVIVHNRTIEKAKQLSETFGIDYCKKNKLQTITAKSDIIINTVPAGVKLLKNHWLKPNHIIFDAIYNNSVYENIAKELKIEFYSGEDWLINQALPAFDLFFKNNNFDFTGINFKTPKPKKKIILTGLMGCEKTHIGNAVSKKLNFDFYDIDTIIENRENSGINDIVRRQGETFLRKSEKKILTELSKTKNKAIISSGSGIVLNKERIKSIVSNYISVWLYANPETIMQKIEPENHPLLKKYFSIEFIEKLMNKRKDFYTETTDLIINTNNKNKEEVVELLLKELSTIK